MVHTEKYLLRNTKGNKKGLKECHHKKKSIKTQRKSAREEGTKQI